MAQGCDGRRQKQIAAEAADWHARMLEPTSEAEVQAFEEWLSTDSAHAVAYAGVEPVSDFGARLPRSLLARRAPGAKAVRLHPSFGFAAAVALFLGAGVWLTTQAPQVAYAAISNTGPAVRGVRLSDGTIAILDSGAELAVVFDRGSRVVTLKSGRVRFKVPSDPERPFSVTAAQAIATGRGTIFDVTLLPGEVRIWAIDGDIALAPHEITEPIALRSGQAVNIRGGRLSRAAIEPEAARWPAGRLAFDNTPLATVVAMANRQGSPKILLGDGAVGTRRVTGVLDIRDTHALARKLAATLLLRVEERDSAILLRR